VLARPGLDLPSVPEDVVVGRAPSAGEACADPGTARTQGDDGRRERTPRLVFVGMEWRRKGGPRLLGWHQSRWAPRGVELHVFGTRAEAVHGTRVFAHGRVPHDELLRDHLQPGDIFVMPTEKDTLLLAAIEASSRGLAVVASDQAGLREAVVHERTGLLCPVRDDAAFINAVERLLVDHQLRRALGGEGVRYSHAEWDATKWYPKMMDRVRGNRQSSTHTR
jgi:glycosyltransferase involved in cell wall biosynthesis